MVKGRKWLVDFNAGKIPLVLFHRLSSGGAINGNIDRSFLDKNDLLR